MAQSTIAIRILLIALILYAIPGFPMSVTTILAMLAMALTGIVSFGEAYAGFSNNAVFLIAGMMIIGHCWFTSGLAHRVGLLLYRFVGANEKLFIAMILIIGAGISVFLNGSLTVAMLTPIIDSNAARSKGSITTKQAYFPLGIAAVVGNNLTTISVTSMITAGAIGFIYHSKNAETLSTQIPCPAAFSRPIIYSKVIINKRQGSSEVLSCCLF